MATTFWHRTRLSSIQVATRRSLSVFPASCVKPRWAEAAVRAAAVIGHAGTNRILPECAQMTPPLSLRLFTHPDLVVPGRSKERRRQSTWWAK